MSDVTDSRSDAASGGRLRSAGSPGSDPRTTLIDARRARGISFGGVQVNIFRELRRHVRVGLLVLISGAVLAGSGYLAVLGVRHFAPTYKTQFLVDASAASALSQEDIGRSLARVLHNSGEHDAIAVRTFGGECGAADNTSQLVDFDTDNRDEIAKAVAAAPRRGKATLVRGVVESAQDFSGPLSVPARQVNRIILVTGRGQDACDDDAGYVAEEIRDRLAAAGLTIELRLIGYQVAEVERELLERIARDAGAPAPAFARTVEDLDEAVNWFTNTEPVLRSAQEVINTLNGAVGQVNTAVEAITAGRLAVGRSALARARSVTTGTRLKDLRGRAKDAATKAIHQQTSALDGKRMQVLAAAESLLAAAGGAHSLGPALAEFERVAKAYNGGADAVNGELAALRRTSPRGSAP